MRTHLEADLEKLRAAQSVIPDLKANPPVRSESRQDGPTCKKPIKPWLRMRAAQRERLNQITGTLGVDAPY